MEYCQHGTLSDYLKSNGNIKNSDETFLQFSKFVLEITSGLRHLHKHKCLHRDLAARNIMLVRELPLIHNS